MNYYFLYDVQPFVLLHEWLHFIRIVGEEKQDKVLELSFGSQRQMNVIFKTCLGCLFELASFEGKHSKLDKYLFGC